ncbi:hypothetical protein [Saccharothrix sp. Mg75]|uniref:hypothetical protein n=1 Tax=Saccharothrix sp. Mg75 TaxID=3445357 RepID=UPI003EECDF0D
MRAPTWNVPARRVPACPYCHTRTPGMAYLRQCASRCGETAIEFPVSVARKGKCPHGRAPKARRVCPACGQAVPREYVEGRPKVVAVLGTTGAGKSTWLASVIRRVAKGHLDDRFPGMSLDVLGEKSRLRHERDRVLVAETVLHRTTGPEPLLVSLRVRPRGRAVVIAFYDSADGTAGNLAHADGLVLAVEPGAVPGDAGIAGLAESMRSARGLRPRTRISLPLAVVLTKLDTVWDMVDPGSPLLRPVPRTGGYAVSDGVDVHHETTAWLYRWNRTDLIRGAHTAFRRHRYFAATALGDRADGSREPVPYRVEDPLLWLLAEFGAIPTFRGEERTTS